MSVRISTSDSTLEGAAEMKRSPSKDAVDLYLVTLEPEENPQCMTT